MQYVGANLSAAVLALLAGTGAQPDDASLHRFGLVVAVISSILLVTAVRLRRKGGRQAAALMPKNPG